MGTDSCAGIHASGISALFHGYLTPVDYVIERMKAGEGSLVPVMGSQTMIFTVRDRAQNEILVLQGGSLRCSEDTVTTSVSSSSQVGNYFNATNGTQGAQYHTANPASAFAKLPGGIEIDLQVNEDGAFGFMAQPLDPRDPRMTSLPKVWISEDSVYRPPGKFRALPIKINAVTCRLLTTSPLLHELSVPLPQQCLNLSKL